MYNLFLDDERFPYVEKCDAKIQKYVSAYHYTNYEPFKIKKWEIVRNYDQFVNIITDKGLPNLIAFDHDLGHEHYKDCNNNTNQNINYDSFTEKTGYDCAKWLCDYCLENNLKFPEYVVHSMNVVGSKNIYKYIENYKKHIENE